MSVNRCRRCNRVLSDPNALYGWRCAEILGVDEALNRAGDGAWKAYMSGIKLANDYLGLNNIDPESIDLQGFYEAMAKRVIAADINDAEAWGKAFLDGYNILTKAEDENGNPLGSQSAPLKNYIEMRDAYDCQNGSCGTVNFLGPPPDQIKRLLNESQISKDGKSRAKTSWAAHTPNIIKNIGNVEKGVVPSMLYVNPLSKSMRIRVDKSKMHSMIMDYGSTKVNPKGNSVFRFDLPDEINGKPIGYHINTLKYSQIQNGNLNFVQKSALNKLNHLGVTKPVYDVFRDFNNVTKIVKKGGKALAIIGVASDIYDFGNSIYADLNDADMKLGKKTLKSATGIGLGWAGSAAGAKLGAMGGAALGTLICPGLGTAIGGFVGGIGLGVAGAIGAKTIGEYVIDNNYKGA